jgi:hypothetical protein
MIPEVIGQGRIALDHEPTAGTFFPLEWIAELSHPALLPQAASHLKA